MAVAPSLRRFFSFQHRNTIIWQLIVLSDISSEPKQIISKFTPY